MLRALIPVVLACIAVLLCGNDTPDEGERSPANEYCPVMPDTPASPEWTTVYRGQRVDFCCNNCLDSFRRNPVAFLDKLPHVPKSDSGNAASAMPISERFSSAWDNAAGAVGQWVLSPQGKIAFVLLTGGLLFGCWRYINKIRARGDRTPVPVRPIYVEMLVFGLAALVIQLTWNKTHLEGEVLEQEVLRVVHHSTYYDHGYPPKPPRPDSPNRLSARFYRGNDERSEFLFNNGNYLTAIFDIGLEREDGTRVRHGESVAGEQLFISFAFERPDHSPDRLYAKQIMDRIYLTQEYGALMGWDTPVHDYLPMERTDSHHWQARYPLGVVAESNATRLDPATATREELLRVEGVTEQVANWFLAYRDGGYPVRGRSDLRQAGIDGVVQESLAAAFDQVAREGTIYVCEANFARPNRQMGARFHYGIQYKLFLESGRVLPESDLWMGSLSRSQKAAKGAIPADQWLSPKPLPMVPTQQDLSDELLGIDDWEYE